MFCIVFTNAEIEYGSWIMVGCDEVKTVELELESEMNLSPEQG